MVDTKKQVPATREHLKDIALLFAVPAAIAIVVVAVVYIPRLFAHPHYDFLYCQGYECQANYSIDSAGKLSPTKDKRAYINPSLGLYYYNVAHDSSRRISVSDTEVYRINTSTKSPDGYTFSEQSSDGGFLFWGDYNSNAVLKNGAKIKPLNLNITTEDDYFIGWIQHER